MGLDMYAYSIDERLVKDEPEIDVNVEAIARRATGFLDLYPFEIERLEEKEQLRYFDKQREANKRAADEGWLDYDFAYWRKFNALHGWMEQLYENKGGTSVFNCRTVRITEDDLNALEKAVRNDELEPTPGFFFGATDKIQETHLEQLKKFIDKARAAFQQGKAVFYDSWW